jgi:putative endonuclease
LKTHNQAIGNWGEALAADYLRQCGYSILGRNARTPYGEIDLVARQELESSESAHAAAPIGACVTVFVEVKTRSSSAFGLPEESITPRKKAHLLASAQAYLQAHPDLDGDWRVDVISIQRSGSGLLPVITHFENAITELP